MPTLNPGLLIEVRRIIEKQPSRHNQGVWLSLEANGAHVEDLLPWLERPLPPLAEDPDHPICRTRGCVAGLAALLSAPPGSMITVAGPYRDPQLEIPGNAAHNVRDWAQLALGLSDEQADYLFSGERSRDEVLLALETLVNYPDASLEFLVEACGDEANEYEGEFD